MGLLKRVLFTIIPVATILIAVSYGIDAIFGNAADLTYLGWTSPTGEYYANVYDFRAYLSALNISDLTKPFVNLANSLDIIAAPFRAIQKILADGYNFGDGIKTIVNGIIGIINALIWVIDMVFSIIQALVIILGKILSLVGININSEFVVIKAFRTFTEFTIIPGIPPLT